MGFAARGEFFWHAPQIHSLGCLLRQALKGQKQVQQALTVMWPQHESFSAGDQNLQLVSPILADTMQQLFALLLTMKSELLSHSQPAATCQLQISFTHQMHEASCAPVDNSRTNGSLATLPDKLSLTALLRSSRSLVAMTGES